VRNSLSICVLLYVVRVYIDDRVRRSNTVPQIKNELFKYKIMKFRISVRNIKHRSLTIEFATKTLLIRRVFHISKTIMLVAEIFQS
jgi:hypothetical protein